MAQSTVANVGNSGNLFVPTVTLKRGATQHVQFGTMLPPNQTTTNNKMRNDTVPPHFAPSVSLTAPPHSHFGHTRIENMSPPASLPKLKLAEISGDPLEWPEWSGLFLSTVHAANIDTSLKMNHLKTLVTGKAKEVIAGLGYTGDMYDIAWNTLVAHFGRPQVVVNAQLRRIYTFPPVKAYDSVALVKYSRIVSSCVQVLTQMNYVGDLQSEGVLNSATRKLPLNMKTKWLTYTRQNANYYMGLEAFSAWLQEIAAVQEDVLMTGNPNTDKSKWASKDKPKNSTFSTFADDSADKKTGHDCPLKDGKHPLWKCEKFLKMTGQARYEKVKELKLCFCCLAGKHVGKDCTYKACGVKGCNRRHHRLLHREANERPKESGVEDPQQKAEANSAFCSLKSSGILPVIPVIIQIGKKQETTLALCDSGASLSFIDKELANKLNAHGEEIDLSVAGIHGTNDVKFERFTLGIRGKGMGDTHHMTVYTHPNIDAGTKIYNYQELKLTYPHLSVLSEETLKLKDVKMILGQNCYHIHRPVEYKSCTNGEPWAVKTKLGWTLCGPLPQQKAVQMTASCVAASEDDALAEQIKTWWDIESYASRCDVFGRSKEDEKALQMLEQTTKFDGERYEVGLLWKRKDPFLPNNYSSALSQMKSLEYRLEKKPELKKLYQDSFKVDVEKGFVRILKQEAGVSQPFMADLPRERLQERVFPFTNTRVDYFSPFKVKFMRKTMKRWCYLFTCLTTRAVHIEVVPSLEAETCLTAITRFIARRGKPATILNDNGTDFVGAAKEMRDCINAWNQSDIETSLAQKDIKWKFNPPGAPHFGGIWERLVRSCKKAMIAVLDGRSLTDDVLITTYNVFSRTDFEC